MIEKLVQTALFLSADCRRCSAPLKAKKLQSLKDVHGVIVKNQSFKEMEGLYYLPYGSAFILSFNSSILDCNRKINNLLDIINSSILMLILISISN
jgi:hypothetical protein